MISLIVAFAVVMVVLAVFLLFTKLNWLQYGAIALVVGILIMFLPVFLQHQSAVKDMEFVSRGEDFSKTYYCEKEDKYYEVALKHNWEFWDVYDVTEIPKEDISK